MGGRQPALSGGRRGLRGDSGRRPMRDRAAPALTAAPNLARQAAPNLARHSKARYE